jgi:hypothetical protein
MGKLFNLFKKQLLTFILIGTLTWLVVLPVILFGIVFANRKNLDSIESRSKWGYFYIEY